MRGITPSSWPGLSRPPRSFLRCASRVGVAGTSPATTLLCISRPSESALSVRNQERAPPSHRTRQYQFRFHPLPPRELPDLGGAVHSPHRALPPPWPEFPPRPHRPPPPRGADQSRA